MSEQLMGVDYFSLETNAKDDDKIFDLKYRYGMPDGADDYDHGAAWAAYGRFVELLASIYADGFAIEVTKQRVLRMSQQLGMTAKEFQDFVQTCVDVGLFDDGLWCREKVLTSRGIQKRYFHAVKRRKGDIPEEYKRWILVGSATDDDSESAPCGNDASTMQTSCKHDAKHDETRCGIYRKEKKRRKEKRKGKKRREEKRRVFIFGCGKSGGKPLNALRRRPFRANRRFAVSAALRARMPFNDLRSIDGLQRRYGQRLGHPVGRPA